MDGSKADGGLLLVVDHAPVPGVARDLLELLGVLPLNGFTWRSEPGDKLFPSQPQVFDVARGTLKPHPITLGSGSEEPVQSVITFGGAPLYPSTEIEPLLVFPRGSVGMIPLNHTFEDAPGSTWPRFSIGGWLQAGARRLGAGRVVILGEAAMCTSLGSRRASGLTLDTSARHQNPRFCLNAVRWLAGQL